MCLWYVMLSMHACAIIYGQTNRGTREGKKIEIKVLGSKKKYHAPQLGHFKFNGILNRRGLCVCVCARRAKYITLTLNLVGQM